MICGNHSGTQYIFLNFISFYFDLTDINLFFYYYRVTDINLLVVIVEGSGKKLEEGRKLGPNLRSPSWACKISCYGLLLVHRMLHNKNYMDSPPAHILAPTFQPNPCSQV